MRLRDKDNDLLSAFFCIQDKTFSPETHPLIVGSREKSTFVSKANFL